jgi:hypothetical protein
MRRALLAFWHRFGSERFSSKHFPENPKKNGACKNILLVFPKVGYSSRAESEIDLRTLKLG